LVAVSHLGAEAQTLPGGWLSPTLCQCNRCRVEGHLAIPAL